MVKSVYDIDNLEKLKQFIKEIEYSYNAFKDYDKEEPNKLEFHWHIELLHDDGVEELYTIQMIK